MGDTDTLKERLASDSHAFCGLMSIIPSKLYYGEDVSDQWKRKKQSKDEARAARRHQLDPNSSLNMNAKQALEERARKRKLEEMIDDGLSLDGELTQELPGEGLTNHHGEEPSKKKKKKSKAKQAEQSAKKAKRRQKKTIDTSGNSDHGQLNRPNKSLDPDHAETVDSRSSDHKPAVPTDLEPANSTADASSGSIDSGPSESAVEATPNLASGSLAVASDSGKPRTDDGDKPNRGGNNRHGTLVEDKCVDGEPKPLPKCQNESKSEAGPKNEQDAAPGRPVANRSPTLVARFEEKLANFRNERYPKDPEKRLHKETRTRADLIEQRRIARQKDNLKLKEKKRLEKEKAMLEREKALKAASVSACSTPRGARSPPVESLAFGRVAFEDGAEMSRDLTYIKKDNTKKKGPSDPKTALAKLENQAAKLTALDESEREEVLEKEQWLAARRRIEGEKPRNDVKLLKKTIKRKEKAKAKSAAEWDARLKAVEQAKQTKQTKREENLRKRQDGKGLGKLKPKSKKSSTNKKPKKAGGGRPGFEGKSY